MENWYSGAISDAVREAKTRRAVFVVYVRDDSEASKSTDQLWSECWTKIADTSRIVALRLDKDSQSCTQFMAIYRVQNYPTIYFINGQNGQVLKMTDSQLNSSEQIEENLRDTLSKLDPTESSAAPVPIANPVSVNPVTETSTEQSTAPSATKSIEEKVAEARARLKEIHEKREEEAKEKEKQDEMARRRLGQQMLLDKQKKEEEILRQRAEELRRDRLEQQQLQAKLKAQIEQDREEKRRKYEEKQNSTSTTPKPTTATTTTEVEKPKVNYSRARIQFRLADGSFFTEDFPSDGRMNDVYNYLQETLPSNQYSRGNYILRTTHGRITYTRDNPQTLSELDLVPSAVLLVIPRTNVTSSGPSSSDSGVTQVFRPLSLLFTWLFAQLNFLYQILRRTLFGNQTPQSTGRASQVHRTNQQRETPQAESRETSTIRRFRNTQDDKDDDDEKRTWNGNSTQQM